MTTKLRIGVIGVGFGTSVQIPGFQSEEIEIMAVCSSREERATQAAKEFQIPLHFTDYRKLIKLKSIDAVSVVTPPALHHPMVIESLKAGKHVLCEKPLALNQNQAEEMYELSLKNQLTTMITHEFRWAPQRAYVKELLEQKYLGEFKFAELSLFSGPLEGIKPRTFSWGLDSFQGGGFLFALGSHYIDALRHWFGDIIELDGQVWTSYPNRIKESEKFGVASADDTFRFSVVFKGGGNAVMHGSSVAPFGQGAQIHLFGTEGALVTNQPGFNPMPDGRVFGAKIGDQELLEIPMPERFTSLTDGRDGRSAAFRLLVREFIRGIETGVSPSPNFLDGVHTQRVLDAILESSRIGTRIKIS